MTKTPMTMTMMTKINDEDSGDGNDPESVDHNEQDDEDRHEGFREGPDADQHEEIQVYDTHMNTLITIPRTMTTSDTRPPESAHPERC
jgi:ABC-type Zn2+ transport system substrate-binding protein/surface adhesin